MLVISRRPGTGFRIGERVRVVVKSVDGRSKVRLGIDAPPEVVVLRDELVVEPDERPLALPLPPPPDFHVVLVEDDPAHAKLVQSALRHAGINSMRVASTGRSALLSLTGDGASDAPRPDLIIRDLLLPDLSGLEVLRAVRAEAHLRRIPVVILSCSDVPGEGAGLRGLPGLGDADRRLLAPRAPRGLSALTTWRARRSRPGRARTGAPGGSASPSSRSGHGGAARAR